MKGEKDRKKWVIITSFICLVLLFAALITFYPELKTTTNSIIIYHEYTVNMPQISEWIDSNANETDDSPWIANASIPIFINQTNLILIKFRISIDDTDLEHSFTDQGSYPDQWNVSVVWGNISSQKNSGITPGISLFEIDLDNSNANSNNLIQNWTIMISAECSGGKPKDFLIFETYKDYGVAIIIESEYTFLEEEIKISENTNKVFNQNIQFILMLSLIIIIIYLIFFSYIIWKKKVYHD